MTEVVPNIVVEEVSLEKLTEMQVASDRLVDSLYVLLPPRGDMSADHYDSTCQHTVLGNAVIRLLISISEKMGPLDFHALRSASFQAFAYVNSIAEPVAAGTVENVN
jgi:hypothetical protein